MSSRAEAAMIVLRRIQRAQELNARALARRTGLSSAQMIVLQIAAEGMGCTPKEIARRTGVSQATITALLDKLEARGFVTRKRGEQDRRLIIVSATDVGRALLLGAPDPLTAAFTARFDRLADWEQLMLLAALERLGGMMDAEDLEPLPALDEPPRA